MGVAVSVVVVAVVVIGFFVGFFLLFFFSVTRLPQFDGRCQMSARVFANRIRGMKGPTLIIGAKLIARLCIKHVGVALPVVTAVPAFLFFFLVLTR